MVVVASLKLVLDDHRVALVIFGNEIHAEVSGILLPFGCGQVEVEDVVENLDVLFQPLRKVTRLMLPHISQRNAVDSSDHRHTSFC